jgi:2-dehydropantoate 2-reductase
MTAEGPDYTKIIVLGTGAIGSFYGSALSRKTDVLLVGRQAHVDAINAHGLKVSGAVEGTVHMEASTELDEIPCGALIVLTTKAYDIEGAIGGINGLLKPGVKILVLQNGLGNEELVRSLVGEDVEVVRGLVSTGVEFLEPGKIGVKLVGETFIPNTETGRRIGRFLDSCGLEVRLSDRMAVETWRKLIMNCVINPLTALLRVPNNEIAAETLRGVRVGIVDECVSVAERDGVALDGDLEAEITRAAASYSNISSMLQDVTRGSRTEIEFLNGRISELGREHGIPTPYNDVLTALIKFIEGKEWK